MSQERRRPLCYTNPAFATSRKRSYLDTEFDQAEECFLKLVSHKNLKALKEFLEVKPILKIDCFDLRGRRALDIIVDLQDPIFLKEFLNLCPVSLSHLYGAVVKCVLDDQVPCLTILLDQFRNTHTPEEEVEVFSKIVEDVATSNLTPLMAAAISNNLDVTSMLLDRHHHIIRPHPISCRCLELCGKKLMIGETLTESIAKLNVYRALASSVYILLTAGDPILTAFQLCEELREMAQVFPERRAQYKELVDQCQTLSTQLLDQCRDSAEVQTLLVQKQGFPDPRPRRFSRLHLALWYKQKEFVTHPSCQQVVRSMWIQGLPEWRFWSSNRKLLHIIQQIFLTPVMIGLYIFSPYSEIIKPLQVPLNRFIYSTTCYFMFLLLLFVTLMSGQSETVKSFLLWSNVAVGIWIFGHTFEVVSNIYSLGLRNFFTSWWAKYDALMFGMFCISQLCVLGSLLVDNFLSETFQERRYWVWYHPILISESIYALASIMAFCRLLLWYNAESHLGPLSTCLRYTIPDVIKFFLVFFLILIAFAAGLNSIYKNYKTHIPGMNESENFQSLKGTFRTLFWAMFGNANPNAARIFYDKQTGDQVGIHYFTEFVGYCIWGAYNLVTAIILLNMLIAMMAETFQKVQGDADKEWKFASSSVWLLALDNPTFVPPPLNLIPSFRTFTHWFKGCANKFELSNQPTWMKNLGCGTACCQCVDEVDHLPSSHQEDTYQKLMLSLIRRYMHSQPWKTDPTSPQINL